MRLSDVFRWHALGSCLALLLVLFIVAGCRHDHHEHDATASRTVIMYMVAENSLYDFSVGYMSDIAEMLQGAGYMTANDHLVIYHDGMSLPAIYHVDKHTKADSYSELKPVYTAANDLNSASPETLRFALDYAMTHYPASEYGIVLWSHASGWIPSNYSQESTSASQRRSFGVDNGHNTDSNVGPQMEISELADALSHYPTFEFIFFDACFMQCIEVAYELRTFTRYLISSPAEIPGTGAPYHLLMRDFFADPVDVKGMMDHYHDSQKDDYGLLLSAIDCAQMQDFADTLSVLLQPHKEQLLAMNFSNVLDYWNFDRYYYRYEYPDYYDILGIMHQAHAQQILSDDEYMRFETALQQVTFYKTSTSWWYSAAPQAMLPVDETQYSGISMFLPLEKYLLKGFAFSDAWFQTPWGQAVWK